MSSNASKDMYKKKTIKPAYKIIGIIAAAVIIAAAFFAASRIASQALGWILNIAGILIAAIVTSGAMYIYYRAKVGRIEAFPVIISGEEAE